MTGNTNHTPLGRLTAAEKQWFANEVRDRVSRFQLTYTWLINRLSDEGLLTDKYEMSATLAGTRKGDKADEILRRSFSILTDYETRMTSAQEP